ncbi:calvin cycle protein CP12-3, chloroplastic [Salvia hispanica]|uniref:calvin cycle protein CP12-3, chloroplastic n=1 Tax=Salvia hispanica TaxID=49212 RepID=UPI0020097554|nr:calvin cycle protein CP12-3, chloroplastic [Salvia hispanica]
MSASLALAAFNFRPTLPFAPPPPSASAPRSGRRTMAGGVRSVMKLYKGTHMREQRLAEMIEKKVAEATQVCGEDETSDECKVAWDEVEEVSQAKADLRLKIHQLQQDPLEHFCQENPETDECRIYED